MKRLLALSAVMMVLAAPHAAAQELAVGFVERGPRFLLGSASAPARIDVARTPVLRQRITLDLNDVSVHDAILAIARQSGLQLMYSDRMLVVERRVTLRAEAITVAAALTEVLLDADVDVLFSPNGNAALIRRSARVEAATGTISGRVTDSSSSVGIEGARLSVDGTRLGARSGPDGAYTINGVATGSQTVVVRRLGYRTQSRTVLVPEGASVTADFSLARTPAVLDEIVVTPTGERQRIELGNVIGTIRADSIVPTTLIRNMSDLLQARTPGVVVLNQSGVVGAPSLIRIRGMSSATLVGDPIVIIDGVRVLSTAPKQLESRSGVNTGEYGIQTGFSRYGTTAVQLFSQVPGPAPARLDDIDPSIIESIDVLRGPSAAALYGTEAANGVVVIKTKRGKIGTMRFNVMADNGWSYIPGDLPLNYFGWGTLANGTPVSDCRLAADVQARPNVADGTCVQDSVTAFQPQNHPYMTTLGTGTSRNISASLSGGTAQLQEFLSFRIADNMGIAKMSQAEENRYRREGVATPSWMKRPNAELVFNGSSRTSIKMRPDLELSITAGGVYRDVLSNGGVSTSTPLRGYGDVASLADTLKYLSSIAARAKVSSLAKRGYTSANMSYTPKPWLLLRGTLGGDYTLRTDQSLVREAECQLVPLGCTSGHSQARAETFVTSMDIGATFSFAPRPWLKTRTSLGEQYNNSKYKSLFASNGFSTSLAFGSELLSPTPVATTTGVQLFNITEQRDEGATAGWYVEQMVGLRDRLFITGAFRQDLASAFGSEVNANAPIYPKLSASWLASEEPFMPRIQAVSSLRFRLAYGHSGMQAGQTAVHNNYSQQSAWVKGERVPGIQILSLGNPDLKPERTAEWEGGFDLSLFGGDRLNIEATLYHKLSRDAILNAPLPPSFGIPPVPGRSAILSQFVNIGSVQNRGGELSISGRVFDSRSLSWDASVIATKNTNKVIDFNGQFVTGVQAGWPLYAYVERRIISYDDTDSDGILEWDELVIGDSTLLGTPYPRSELAYASTFSVLGGALRMSANVSQINRLSTTYSQPTRGRYDRAAPLSEQAAAIRIWSGEVGVFIPASAVRLNELSATYNAPARLAQRYLRAQSASLTLAGRNLALWTNYAGFDPTTDYGTSFVAGQEEQRRDGSSNSNTIPSSRNWTVRVNLGF